MDRNDNMGQASSSRDGSSTRPSTSATAQPPPLPTTPVNMYSGVSTGPSTGYLTPSLHGSPGRRPMPFTPASSYIDPSLHSGPFALGGHGQSVNSSHFALNSGREVTTPISNSSEFNSWYNASPFGGSSASSLQNAISLRLSSLLTPTSEVPAGRRPPPPSSEEQDSGIPNRVLFAQENPPSQENMHLAAQLQLLQQVQDNGRHGIEQHSLPMTPASVSRPAQPAAHQTPGMASQFPTPTTPYSPMGPPASSPSTGTSTAGARTHGRRPFHPMQVIAQNGRQASPGTPTTPGRGYGTGSGSGNDRFSAHYHGMHTESNASADHLPDDKNCGLWVTNLPPDVTVRDLLSQIRNIGRIWCTYINPADHVRHHTAAAKIVFFTPEAARRLLTLSFTSGLYVRGFKVRADYNRIKSEEHVASSPETRVLIITGAHQFVNETTLTAYFKERFVFEVDDIKELIRAGPRAVVEYRFGSYRCQAQMGKMALEKDRPLGFEKVEFGEDPCEVGDILSAYGIAAERIQGRGI